MKIAALGLAVLAAAALLARGTPQAAPQADILKAMGEAYAKDLGLKFSKVVPGAEVKITEANRAEWQATLVKALAVGYAPDPATFKSTSLESLGGAAKIRMGRDRTPADVVGATVAPGNSLVEVAWHFGSSPPVKSYTVFSAQRQPVFDTILSLPVVQGPLLSPGHF